MKMDDTVVKQLDSEAAVRVCVGKENYVFYIQKPILANISSKLKTIVSKAEYSSTDGRLHLSLPKDDYEAWKVLLHWIMMRPQLFKHEYYEGYQLLLVRSWTLGEQYSISEFQDEIMLSLLLFFDRHTCDPSAIKTTFVLTQPGSKLRCLMAEELLYLAQNPEEDEDQLDGAAINDLVATSKTSLAGLITELLIAERKSANSPEELWHRFIKKDDVRYGRWKGFMVGDGLSVHGCAAEREAERAEEEDCDESE